MKKFRPGKKIKCQLIRIATQRDRFIHRKGPDEQTSWGTYLNTVNSYQASKRAFPDIDFDYPRFTNRYYS